MSVDEPGNRIYVRPAQTEVTRAAQVAAAAQQTDAAAVAAKPNGARYARNPTESSRQEFVTAYTPVYQHVVYELELLVDGGLDAATAADQVKQRHRHDPLMDQVVTLAGEQVANESAAARRTNEVAHQARPSFEAAVQARDQATQQKTQMSSTPWKGSADAYDRQLARLDDTISQSTALIDGYINDVSYALGEEVDQKAHEVATQRGAGAPSVEDYSVARDNISRQHADPLIEALLDTAVSQRPDYLAAVSSLDESLRLEAQRVANERREEQAMRPPQQQPPGVLQVIGGSPSSPPGFTQPATITREDYAQAGKNLSMQLPGSQSLIDSRAEFLAGLLELKEIRATGDSPSLPSASSNSAAARNIPDNHLDGMRELARRDPVAYWGVQQAARHGVIFDPFDLQLPQWFSESRVAQVDGATVHQYRIGTDAQGAARWASEQELRELAISSPDKFALFALAMQGRTALGVSGEQAAKSIMSLQVLLRHEDVSTRATDKFELGEAASARGDHDAARGLWNEALGIIATNQRQAQTPDEARLLGEISGELFTRSWMSSKIDELPFESLGVSKTEMWGELINDVTRNGAAPPQFANMALDVYRAKFDSSWIREHAAGDAPGDQLFKALSRLTEVTGRATEIAKLLTDEAYAPVFRYMNRTEYAGIQAAIADPEGVSPHGAASLARAYMDDPDAFTAIDARMQSDVAETRDTLSGLVNEAEKKAPSLVGQQNARELMNVQLTDFDADAGKSLHGFFDPYTDPARGPEHFTVEGSQTVDVGNQLVNYVGWALGLRPTLDFSLLDGNEASEVWFEGNQLRALEKVTAAIREAVGDTTEVEIQATPYVYVDREHQQYVESSLFVVTVNGKEKIFTEQGAAFDSWDAWFNGNELSDKGRLYLLKQNQPEVLQASGAQYDIKDFDAQIESRRANVRTDFEGFKDGFETVTSIDFDDAVSAASMVAGIVAIPLTGGGSLALTAMAIGGSLYMAAVAINDLVTMERNGHDLTDLSNDQVRSNWETLGVTALMLALPGLKLLQLKTAQSAIRLEGEAAAAANVSDDAARAEQFVSRAENVNRWASRTATVTRGGTGVAVAANLGVNVDQLHILFKNWEGLSTADRWKQAIFTIGGWVAEPAAKILDRYVTTRQTTRSSAPSDEPPQFVGVLLGPDGRLTQAVDGAPVLLVLDANGIPVTDHRGRVLQWLQQPDGQVVKAVLDPRTIEYFSRPHSPMPSRADRLPAVSRHPGEHVVAAAPEVAPAPPISQSVRAHNDDTSVDVERLKKHRVVNPRLRRGSTRPGADHNGRPGNRGDATRPHQAASRPDTRGGGASPAGVTRGTDPDPRVLATLGTRPSALTGAAAANVPNAVHIKLADAAQVTAQADLSHRSDITASSDNPSIVNSAQPPDEANKPHESGDGNTPSDDGAHNTSHHASSDGAPPKPDATGARREHVPPSNVPDHDAADAVPAPSAAADPTPPDAADAVPESSAAADATPPDAVEANATPALEAASTHDWFKKNVAPFLPYGAPALLIVPYLLAISDSRLAGALSQFVGRVRGVHARGPGYGLLETAELVALRNAIEGDFNDAKATIQALARWRLLTGMSKEGLEKMPIVIGKLETIAQASRDLADAAALHDMDIDSVRKVSHKPEEIVAAAANAPEPVRDAAQRLADAVGAFERYEMGRPNAPKSVSGTLSRHSALTLMALGTAVSFANPFGEQAYLWGPDAAAGLIGTARQILQMENKRRLDALRASGNTDAQTLEQIQKYENRSRSLLRWAERLTAVGAVRGGYATLVYFGVIGHSSLPPPYDKYTGVFAGVNALAHVVWFSTQRTTSPQYASKPEDAFSLNPANIGRMRTLRNTAMSLYIVSTVGGFATALAVINRTEDQGNNNKQTPPPSPVPTQTSVPPPHHSVTPAPTSPPASNPSRTAWTVQ